MPEVIDHFHERSQALSEAKQLLDGVVAQGRGLNKEERANYEKYWDDAENARKAQGKAEAESMAKKVGDAYAEAQESLEQPEGVTNWREINGNTLQAYREKFNARSVPYRWGMQGPSGEGVVPNPYLPQEWSEKLSHQSSEAYQNSFEIYLGDYRGERATTEMRNQQIDLDELGGFLLAPIQMQNEILKIADNMVYIRQWADVEPQVMAKSFGVPFLETDLAEADWTGELTEVEVTTANFGMRALNPRNLTKMVRESFDAMMMKPSLSGYLISRLGYQRGVTEERGYLLGNGVNEPLGAYTASNKGIDTDRDFSNGNEATAPTLVGLQTARWALKANYLMNAKWMGHRDFYLECSIIRGTDGHPIWYNRVSMREPDMLLGFPAFVSEYSPNDFTTGKYVGIFADWMQGYKIADAYDMTIQRVDQRWAEKNLIAYIMRSKTDGMPVLPEAFARVTLG